MEMERLRMMNFRIIIAPGAIMILKVMMKFKYRINLNNRIEGISL